MRKSAGRFVVEYKNTRRKAVGNPNSIWGNLDLGSVARQIESETLPSHGSDSIPLADRNHASSQDEGISSSVTSTGVQLSTALVVEDVSRAEDKEIAADISNGTADVLPTHAEEPEQGRERQNQNMTESSGNDLSDWRSDRKRPTRGRPKNSKNKTNGKSAGRAKPAATAQSALPPSDIAVDISASVDEMDDLLKLEQENQQLRRMLVLKLRKENVILRQLLGRG